MSEMAVFTEVFAWDFSAYGADGYGVRVYAVEKEAGAVVYQAHFAKGRPNKDKSYVCDADSAGFLMRVIIDRFMTWCDEADDYDVAILAGAMANKICRYHELKYNEEHFD